jgi:inhibitor of cysteine peptidase
MDKKYFFKSAIIILICLFILTGCTLIHKYSENKYIPAVNQPVVNNQTIQADQKAATTTLDIKDQLARQTKMDKFKNYDDLKSFLEENNVAPNYLYYSDIARPLTNSAIRQEKSMSLIAPTAAVDSISSGGAVKGSAVPAPDQNMTGQSGAVGESHIFSGTNNQVQGVDESDIIKTDGTYIYTVSKNNLFIVKANPSESAEILSKIEFKSRPADLYINGDNLIVFGQDDNIYNLDAYKLFKRHNQYTFFKVFNISDKKNPKQIRDLNLEGVYSDSRMIGDYVYFVTANNNFYYIDKEPVIPRILENGQALTSDCSTSAKCFAPDVYYFDMPYSSVNYTSVNAINIKDNSEEPTGDIYIMSANQNMYVSKNNIYLSYTKYLDVNQLQIEAMKDLVYSKLSKGDQDKIDKIEASENFILTPDEKKQKISQIIERYGAGLSAEEQSQLQTDLQKKIKEKYQDISDELEKTVIHKIAIDKNKLTYVNFGEVTGQIINQFSMDEDDGYFRIATTKNQTWSQFDDQQKPSSSNLFVLDKDMKVVGSVKGLAEGESIYSVRFIKNRAYLVTYKQVDPLFVIDLSDPKNPTVLGQLKMPGFSNYLHPYDDTTLIGVGKDTTINQWGGVQTTGLKLSLIDVSDVGHPKELASSSLGNAGSDSIALSDHKAFLFSLSKNLLVIPVTLTSGSSQNFLGNLTFNGAAVFKVDKTGFVLKGKIDHSNGGIKVDTDYWNGYNYYDNTVKRSLYIDDTLITFSNNYLKMNSLTDLKLIKNLELKKEKTGAGSDFNIVN